MNRLHKIVNLFFFGLVGLILWISQTIVTAKFRNPENQTNQTEEEQIDDFVQTVH